ncbi:MAG: glutamate--tRNA ligase, partial [Chthoniobacterales bacterium]
MSEIRTRFAPSPTGYLHVGGARTALFNWLYARKHGGKFILRIEDTDAKRNTDAAYQVIYDGLRWLELNWDEGPEIDGLGGGDAGPYFQSQRNAIYEKHLATLQSKGMIYEDEGALRFRSPRKTVVHDDLVCGHIEFDMSNPLTHPDMTIRRPDGSWIFHFVNVVDDLEMRLTHVIRGEDHLSNTPKHIELYQALDATPPKFAHIPLILNHEGKKLSKRDGGASITQYIDQGYAPEAVNNYLCLLGWSPKDNREFLPLAEIQELFDLHKINRRNAIFDLDKCFWLQGQHILHMSLDRFVDLGLPFLDRANIAYGTREAATPVLEIVKEKIKHLSDLPQWTSYFFTEKAEMDPASVQKVFGTPEAFDKLALLRQAYANLDDWTAATLEATLKTTASENNCKTGTLIHPARVASSGRSVGPSLYHMLEVLGKEKVLTRFDHMLEQRKPIA